jgi:hypothetical protein
MTARSHYIWLDGSSQVEFWWLGLIYPTYLVLGVDADYGNKGGLHFTSATHLTKTTVASHSQPKANSLTPSTSIKVLS